MKIKCLFIFFTWNDLHMNAYTSQHVKRTAKQLANPKYIRKQCKWVIITAATSC